MGSTFSLDSIREESERRYGNVTITDVDGHGSTLQLSAPLRLSDAAMDKVQQLVSEIEGLQTEANSMDTVHRMDALMREVLTLVADQPEVAGAMFDALDRPDRNVLFEKWIADTQPGEASA